ncbi:hypothetical protein F3Y22_tig00111311pilonHSYRG00298 [Hibiscus syriacus]|uniref:Secreted protein n=1 Tax=Hibiscus syriacus TaxID=106335 RepID=A0A6A2YQK0_HIBSY|nr:hypothetical protein F3Y22_tig00111311pilonHSYRG00298 [Hibiscus syriacus]
MASSTHCLLFFSFVPCSGFTIKFWSDLVVKDAATLQYVARISHAAPLRSTDLVIDFQLLSQLLERKVQQAGATQAVQRHARPSCWWWIRCLVVWSGSFSTFVCKDTGNSIIAGAATGGFLFKDSVLLRDLGGVLLAVIEGANICFTLNINDNFSIVPLQVARHLRRTLENNRGSTHCAAKPDKCREKNGEHPMRGTVDHNRIYFQYCRWKLLKNKRLTVVKQLREDLAQLIKLGHEKTAFNRVEQLVKK